MADRGGVPASDAASSNDTSSPATEPGIRALSKTSPFMVQDIDDPTCFICMESDKESGEQGTRDAGQTQDRFIHPCRCSLVAHESCLHEYSQDQEARGGVQAVACPQCKAPYQFEGKLGPLVRIFDKGNIALRDAGEYGFVLALAGVVWAGGAAYGACASAAFLGKPSAITILARDWRENGCVVLFGIPCCMLSSRIPGTGGWIHHKLTYVTFAAWLWKATMNCLAQVTINETIVPALIEPRLAATFLSMGTLNMAYCFLRRKVTQWALKPYLKNWGEPRRRIQSISYEISLDQGPPTAGDTDAEHDDHIPVGVERIVDEKQNLPLNRVTYKRTYHHSQASVALITMETLAIPFIAASIGRGMSFLATRMTPGNWLECLLNPRLPGKIQPWVDRVCPPEDDFFWRNTLSLGLYIVGRDSTMLLYRYSRLRHRKTRTIKDLPFSDSIAATFKHK